MIVFVHLDSVLLRIGVPTGSKAFFSSGIDLFFVISGFIMVHTTGAKPIRPWTFFRLRIARIAPLYWILTLGAFGVAWIRPAAMKGTASHPADLLKSLLFVPYVRDDGFIRPILFVGWSLNLEMAFYLVFSITLFLRRPWHRVSAGCLALISASFIGLVNGRRFIIIDFMCQPLILEFAFGMLIAAMFARYPSGFQFKFRPILGILLILGGGMLLIASIIPHMPTFAAPAVLTVILAIALEQRNLKASWTVIIAVGDASYALYLVHPFVTQASIDIFTIFGQSTFVALATLFIAVTMSILISIQVHRLIEKPINRFVLKRMTH